MIFTDNALDEFKEVSFQKGNIIKDTEKSTDLLAEIYLWG